MSITSFIASICVQTAVYWEPAGNTGYGETWNAPVEILCRWDDEVRNITNKTGTQIISMARVMVKQNLNEQGYLYLGSLSDLSDVQKANPKIVPKAHQIQRIMKTPLFKKTDQFVYQIYL